MTGPSNPPPREYVAGYFNLTDLKGIPERALIVPPIFDARFIRKFLTGYKISVNEYLGSVGLGIGKYEGNPVSVLACGVGS